MKLPDSNRHRINPTLNLVPGLTPDEAPKESCEEDKITEELQFNKVFIQVLRIIRGEYEILAFLSGSDSQIERAIKYLNKTRPAWKIHRYKKLTDEDLRKLKLNSTNTIAMLKEQGCKGFDYSETSVKILADLITKQSGTYSEEMLKSLPQLWGAYLGESIIQRYGGHWVILDGQFGVSVPESGTTYPMSEVKKHMLLGKEECIYTSYQIHIYPPFLR